MKTIAIGTLKGGVGKTQTVFNIVGFLAEMGKKVLVFDNDPQGNTTNDFGLDKRESRFIGAEEIYENDIKADDIIIKSPIEGLSNLDIIPGTILLTRTEMRVISLAGRELILKNWFKKNMKVLSQYDYVIFDTNPSMSVINQNVFLIADSIIVVSDIGMNSLDGAEYFIELWSEIIERLDKENNIKAFIMNKYRKGVNVDRDFLEYIKEHEVIKEILVDTPIPLNTKLNEAEINNLPINMYDRTSTGYKAFKKVINELMEKGVI
ncbi:ParA family protein [Clostridiisalibacter paucivorans]|uniref:ParA family protein n=1 Tax=Clostridiisalibacter paucivorans TaxID=408753 RepID=UPI00047A45A9|nr:AAA family ATPase [Clostridiisalibacter paucivorans]